MPFVTPTIPFAFGSRGGNTTLLGSLNATQSNGVFRIGAEIGASIPTGVITTRTSWGFVLGAPPPGTTTLVVIADGFTFERGSSMTWWGYASATAELSTTIEEFNFNRVTRRFELVRVATSAPTVIFNLTNYVLGAQSHLRDATAVTLLGMPVTPGRLKFYRCWINADQTASCHGGAGGAGGAVSRFFFDMDNVFFAFT